MMMMMIMMNKIKMMMMMMMMMMMTVYVPLLQQQLLRKHHLYNLLVFDSSLVQNEKFIMTFSQRISREYISKKSNLSKFKLIHIPVFLLIISSEFA